MTNPNLADSKNPAESEQHASSDTDVSFVCVEEQRLDTLLLAIDTVLNSDSPRVFPVWKRSTQ